MFWIENVLDDKNNGFVVVKQNNKQKYSVVTKVFINQQRESLVDKWC